MDERLRQRLERQPMAIREFIQDKDREIATLRAKIDELLGDAERDPLRPTVADYVGPLDGRQLPCHAVRFGDREGNASFVVSLDRDHPDRLLVRSDKGLIMRTNASNMLYLSQGWD